MKKVTKLVKLALDMVKMFHNPRADFNMNIGPLKADIMENGLTMPIVVAADGGFFHLVMGHRRFTAISQIAAENEKLFSELFPDGIPAIVHEGLTREEIEALKVDEGNTQPLSTKYELLNCSLALFNAGATEKTVANALNGLLNRIVSPMSAKQQTAVREKEQQIIEHPEAESLLRSEIETIILEARRGTVQHLHAVCKLPAVVRLSYYKKHTGHNPEGVTQYLPALTNGDVDKLSKAFQKDLETDSQANIKVGGKMFWELFNKISEAEQKKAGRETVRVKAMASKDVDAVIAQSGSADLKGFVEATRDCKVEFDFAAFGRIVYIAHNLVRNNPDFWAECENESDSIDEEMAKKMQEIR